MYVAGDELFKKLSAMTEEERAACIAVGFYTAEDFRKEVLSDKRHKLTPTQRERIETATLSRLFDCLKQGMDCGLEDEWFDFINQVIDHARIKLMEWAKSLKISLTDLTFLK